MWAKIAMGAGFAALVAFTSPAFAETRADYFGHWENVDPATRSIVKVDISPGPGNKIRVRVYGACHPNPCDWGEVIADQATLAGSIIYRVNYDQGFAIKHVRFNINPIGTLKVRTQVNFTEADGRTDYATDDVFHH